MCIKKIYQNTYADGAQDVTEEIHPCREGRISHAPEVRKYNRKLPYNKGSRYLGDLPTPRRSKSPSPLPRRDSTYVSGGSGLVDIDVSATTKHYGHRDRSDRHERRRRSSRHMDDLDPLPPSPGLKRSMTSPHSPHYVVIDQDQSRFRNLDIPLGPVHVVDDIHGSGHSHSHGHSHGHGHRRHSSRDYEPSSSNVHVHRRNSVNPQSYVIVNDHKEQRRHDRKRRMSTTTEVPPAAPPAPNVHPSTATGSRRFGPRRAATIVQPSDSSNATSTGSSSSPPKHVRWEEKVRRAREKHNAEIDKRDKLPDPPTQQPSGLKGILKRATTGEWKGKGRDTSEAREIRRAVERMDLPPSPRREELDLYDRDRLKARFGHDDESDRERRRRSKVWLDGDRYKYL